MNAYGDCPSCGKSWKSMVHVLDGEDIMTSKLVSKWTPLKYHGYSLSFTCLYCGKEFDRDSIDWTLPVRELP